MYKNRGIYVDLNGFDIQMTVKLFPNPGDYFRSANSEFMGKTKVV